MTVGANNVIHLGRGCNLQAGTVSCWGMSRLMLSSLLEVESDPCYRVYVWLRP